MPTPVNDQVTDAVTQTNGAVLDETPATAMANAYQSLVHAMGMMFENAVYAQQQGAVTAQAATTMGVATLYKAEQNSGGAAAVLEPAPSEEQE